MSTDLALEIGRYRERADPSRVSVLERRARTEVTDRLRGSTVSLMEVGIYPIVREPISLQAAGKTWLLMRIEDDPDFARGAFLIPANVKDDLEVMRGRGVEFDQVFVAHEVRQAGTAMPTSFVPAYAALDEMSVRLGKLAQNALLAASAPAALGVVAGVAAVPAAVVVSLGAIMIGVDPVLCAAIAEENGPEHGRLGYWFFLGKWEYMDG